MSHSTFVGSNGIRTALNVAKMIIGLVSAIGGLLTVFGLASLIAFAYSESSKDDLAQPRNREMKLSPHSGFSFRTLKTLSTHNKVSVPPVSLAHDSHSSDMEVPDIRFDQFQPVMDYEVSHEEPIVSAASDITSPVIDPFKAKPEPTIGSHHHRQSILKRLPLFR